MRLQGRCTRTRLVSICRFALNASIRHFFFFFFCRYELIHANSVRFGLVNLHRRNIVPSPSCAWCHNSPEDSLHAVWYCEAITGVWSMLEWFRQTALPHPTSFSELLACFLFCREEFRAEVFVIIVWLL